jgi:hypothetical protein
MAMLSKYSFALYGCTGFSRKRSPTSRCARSFHRSASMPLVQKQAIRTARSHDKIDRTPRDRAL